MEYNMKQAFIVGAAINRGCANAIDEVYYKNEKEYHKAYLTKGLSKDVLKEMFSMRAEDRINKLSGIVEVCEEKGDLLPIEKVIRGIHFGIVKFVKNSNKIDIDVYMRKYKLHKLIEEEQFSIGAALLYLGIRYEKEIVGAAFFNFVVGKWDLYIRSLYNNVEYIRKYGQVDCSREVTEFIDKVYPMLNMKRNTKLNENLGYFIGELIEKDTYKKLGVDYDVNHIERVQHITVEEYEKVRHELFTENGISGYIGCFSRYLKMLGVESSEIFMDTDVTNDVLEDIFRDCYYGIKYNGVPESETKLYVVACLFIYNMVEVYKECKDLYLNKLLEDKYKEAMELEAQIENKKKILSLEIEKHKRKNEALMDENAILKQKIKELERENARLSAKETKDGMTINELELKLKESSEVIESFKEDYKTLLEVSITQDKNISKEDKIKYINQFKIGIFGGLSSIKMLSNRIKNVTFYDSQNQDISSVANLNAVFISYEFFSHSFMNKVNSACNKYNVAKRYISGTNEDLIIDSIYSQLIAINN